MLLKAVRALPAADALEPVASAIAASTAPSNPLHPDDQRLAWSVVRDHILDVNHVQVLEAKVDRSKEECLTLLRNQWLRDVLDLIDQHYHDGCGGVDVQDYLIADVVSADRMLEIEEIGLNERQDIIPVLNKLGFAVIAWHANGFQDDCVCMTVHWSFSRRLHGSFEDQIIKDTKRYADKKWNATYFPPTGPRAKKCIRADELA